MPTAPASFTRTSSPTGGATTVAAVVATATASASAGTVSEPRSCEVPTPRATAASDAASSRAGTNHSCTRELSNPGAARRRPRSPPTLAPWPGCSARWPCGTPRGRACPPRPCASGSTTPWRRPWAWWPRPRPTGRRCMRPSTASKAWESCMCPRQLQRRLSRARPRARHPRRLQQRLSRARHPRHRRPPHYLQQRLRPHPHPLAW